MIDVIIRLASEESKILIGIENAAASNSKLLIAHV